MATSECLLLVLALGMTSAYIEDDIHGFQIANDFLFNELKIQQFFTEQRARTARLSGVKTVRQRRMGTKPYHAEAHTGHAAFNIHNQANEKSTLGMGDFAAVLNGYEFRTRQNDYAFRMKHKTSQDFGATQEIPYPDVPPEVLSKSTLSEQIQEMQEWYRAFKNQDRSARDYTKYFKPHLCYLEGMVTGSNIEQGDTQIVSTRHTLNPKGWDECHKKTLFNGYSGGRDEHIAALPTQVLNIFNGSVPKFGQWNYQILCHPLRKDVPLNRFRVIDDVQTRVREMRTKDEHVDAQTNDQRFRLCQINTDKCSDGPYTGWAYLDDLMFEIPGMSGQRNTLTDNFDRGTFHFKTGGVLKNGFYHRKYKTDRAGDFGTLERTKSFSDTTAFMAMTDRAEIAAETALMACDALADHAIDCKYITSQRWTYAIPLEIVYTHPLHSWNPLRLSLLSDEAHAQANADRDGGLSVDKAFEGISAKHFYMTPQEMFSGPEVNQDSADTVKDAVAVLNAHGDGFHTVYASGHRVFLPDIPGVGTIRTRYPIAPVVAEGNVAWKEVTALKDVLQDVYEKKHMYPSHFPFEINELILRTRPSHIGDRPPHIHLIKLNMADTEALKKPGDRLIVVDTEPMPNGDGHTHNLRIRKFSDLLKIEILKCDGTGAQLCEHPQEIVPVENWTWD